MRRASLLWWTGLLAAAVGSGCTCGPAFPFTPSNLPADAPLNATEDIVFNGELCGTRAIINTDTGDIDCFNPGVFNPRFSYTSQARTLQADGTEVALIVGRNVRVDLNNELQVLGSRPLVLVALQTMTIMGRITAQNAISKAEGEAGGASEPTGAPAAGLGAGGGAVGATNTGAGGASYCGRGGKGGDDTSPVATGGAGGTAYGTPELVPLRAGSSGGKNGNHSGAGGGAVQLVAGTSLEISAEGSINLGGMGGGWFGNGGGSGGAILLEAPTVTVAGVLAVNGGGGGGGSSAGGQDGANGAATANAAPGGAGGASGGQGGAGSADTNLDGSPGGTTSGQAGGGGGGAGRIRINTSSGMATTLGATLSPPLGTPCATQGTIAPGT